MKKFTKRIIVGALALTMGCGVMSGCKDIGGFKYDYGFEELSAPFWRSEVMYNESVLLADDGEGNIFGKLAFKPEQIYSVRDYTLNNEYKAGVDYEFRDGAIYKLENSEIPYFTQDQLHGKEHPQNDIKNVIEGADKDDVLFTSSYDLFIHQIFVTYSYKPDSYEIPVQDYCGEKLAALNESLDGGYDLNILVLGDSISGGGQSSSNGNLDPFCPDWVDIYGTAVQNAINKKNKTDCIVTVTNKSVGGMTSAHDNTMSYSPNGTDTYAEFWTKQVNPDLVIIAHGMNDGTWYVSADQFKASILETMRQCQSVSSKTLDFVIVGTMRPNDNGGGWYGSTKPGGGFIDGYVGTPCYNLQHTYAPVMREFCEEQEHAVFVDTWDLHTFLLTNKKYEDMTVNNLNHPNDFFIRCYAMCLIQATLPV